MEYVREKVEKEEIFKRDDKDLGKGEDESSSNLEVNNE